MIDLLNKYSKEELFELFNSFNKKGDIHEYFGITDNSSGVKYIKMVADEIGFDLNTYAKRKKRYCLLCGEELESGQYKFCCSSHAATYNNKLRPKKVKKQKKNEEKEIKIESNLNPKYIKLCKCRYCGTEFKYRARKIYCLQECYKKQISNEKYAYFKEHSEEFCRGNFIPRKYVRRNILQEQNNVCAICGSEQTHNKKPLVFVLDHIDGDASNNRRENLRMICPNCDSQLDTFKSKNKNSKRRNYWKEHIIKQLSD